MRIPIGGVLVLTLGFSIAEPAVAQSPAAHILTPQSSQPVESSKRQMHTTLHIMVPAGGLPKTAATQGAGLPPFPGLLYETPASFACVYKLIPYAGKDCNPNLVTEHARGGGPGVIAIVDAYDYPTAAEDLVGFSAQFGLPPAKFMVKYAAGPKPGVDPTGGWELEEALDIEWAHAMAPHAKIYLVEAASNFNDDLLAAVDAASQLVAGEGGGEVSMSWGGGEFNGQETIPAGPSETDLDSHFTMPGVVYLAAAGDSGGTIWPSVSPNVVSAGGTSISRDLSTGAFVLENTWQNTGGGPSLFEPRPHYQDRIRRLVGESRGTPDISLDSNPASGVWVLATNVEGTMGTYWWIVGGTSLATPALAGIINAAGALHSSSQEENGVLYHHFDDGHTLRDITYGNCGLYVGNFAQDGWDFCSGVGTPLGLMGK